MTNGRQSTFKWTVGVIAAPRAENYLEQTVSSLKDAGWNDITVFAEPGTPPPSFAQFVQRLFCYGDWTNWATAFYELLLSKPDTDLFLMCEDDVLLCRNVKSYVEQHISDLGHFGYLSLYTPSTYHRPNFIGFHNENRGMRTLSTVALIFRKEEAISIFSNPEVQRHRFMNIFGVDNDYWGSRKDSNVQNSIKDAVLGKWAESNDLPIYFHTPSLAEHIGQSSTLIDGPSTIQNGRCSKDFIGANADLDFKPAIRSMNCIPLL